MTVTEKLQALIVAAASSTVPAGRIKSPAKSNQGLDRPYIVHWWDDVDVEQTHGAASSASNLEGWAYRVHIAADSHGSGEALFFTLKASLPGVSDGFTVRYEGGNYAGFDEDSGVHDFLLRLRVSE